MFVKSLGKALRLLEIRLGRLAPQQIHVRRVGNPTCDSLIETRLHVEEAFSGTSPRCIDKRAITLIDIGGQKVRPLGIRTRDEHRRHITNIRGKPGRNELADRVLSRHENLAPHVAAFLRGRQLILEMDTGSARVDHLLHQLECVQHPAEAGFGVGHDRLQPVDFVVAFRVIDLIRPPQRIVDSPHDRRHRVRGV